ncbi:MAG: FmdB family zinc ribbon protein [Acidimicrobiales bacterium]|jgi:putative FmdB family regulatory protein
MPTYEYACKSCGEHLEVVQSFKDSALTECPACGGTLRKVFGNIGITFKGSGFYKTDSRSDGHKGASKVAEPKAAEASTDSPAKAAGAPANGSKAEAASRDGGTRDGGTKHGGTKDAGTKPSVPAGAAAAS